MMDSYLAETLIEIGRLTSELRDQLANEKYVREQAEKDAKQKAELAVKWQKDRNDISSIVDDFRIKIKELESKIVQRDETIKKLRKRKK